MNEHKVMLVKYDDYNALVESLKKVMETYHMSLNDVDGNRYVFDMDGSYDRALIINPVINGWIPIVDDEQSETENLALDLSQALSCFIVCLGYIKDVLYYTTFQKGEQTDQYMSSFEYYEYEIDDDTVDSYRGNVNVFEEAIDPDKVNKLGELLEESRNGLIGGEEGFIKMQTVLNIIHNKKIKLQGEEIEEEDIELHELFYVDFENINIRIDEREEIIESIIQIVDEMGYERVEEFKNEDANKGGFFKKILNSVSENRRIIFYVSPPSEGWVTIAGEEEILMGGVPSEWSFVHIEDRLSEILDKEVISIYANSENWGFKIYKSGKNIYQYSLGMEVDSPEDVISNLPVSISDLSDIFEREIYSAEDIDDTIGEFCTGLGIKNYKINIPMDYSEEEYYENVIDKLPDKDGFINLKFVQKK
jgi:hypothetical protein